MGPALTMKRIRAGVWEGVLTGTATPPRILVTHLEEPIPGVEVLPQSDASQPDGPRSWGIRVPIPAGVLSEGVQTFLIDDAETGARLGHFTVITGAAVEEDMRAEIDLLRAELDMLKRAFRRHCLETAGPAVS